MGYRKMWQRLKEYLQSAIDEAEFNGYDSPLSAHFDKYRVFRVVMAQMVAYEMERKNKRNPFGWRG